MSKGTSRIEGFSDSVFAFSLTLLAMATEVPKTFDDLMGVLRGLLPFAACFALLVWLWWSHHVFFRRYGSTDGFTVTLNAVLLFMLVFYIYPLKFLAGLVLSSGPSRPTIRGEDGPALMVIYAAGYAAVALIFWAMHARAVRLKDRLRLSDLDVYDARTEGYAWLAQAAIALASATTALTLGSNYLSYAGCIYFLNGPVLLTLHSRRADRWPKVEAAPQPS